jgi:hypothetical protein
MGEGMVSEDGEGGGGGGGGGEFVPHPASWKSPLVQTRDSVRFPVTPHKFISVFFKTKDTDLGKLLCPIPI